MKTFRYILRDESGKQYTGTYDAVSHSEVIVWARCQGRIPVLIEELDKAGRRNSKKKKTRSQKVKLDELAAFCWQISTMMDGGVSITEALEVTANDIENQYFGEILQSISQDIKAGSTFSESLKKYPKVFNTFFHAMTMAGESSGNIPPVFRRLADYFIKREKLVREVKGALSYPCFVVGFVVLIVVVMGTMIIPRFKDMFKMFKNELPAFTQNYMAVYDYIGGNFWWMAIVIGTVTAAATYYFRTVEGHRVFSRITLRMPIAGNIILNAFVTTFCNTTSTLLMAGVPVLETLDIVKAMSKNDMIREAMSFTQMRIEEGENISAAMDGCGLFPNIVIKMAQVGEQSGSLSDVFDKTSDYFQRKVENLITSMTRMIEPVMMVGVGGIVLVTVIALYLPVFTMSDV